MNLWSIYRCGDSARFFYMEVGRHSAIGAGELYMETDDPLIAQNMHTTIIKWVLIVERDLYATNKCSVSIMLIAMNQYFNFLFSICYFRSAMSTSKHRDDLGPITRNRSSSANEASKPISMLQRRQTHVGAKPMNFSPSNGKYFQLLRPTHTHIFTHIKKNTQILSIQRAIYFDSISDVVVVVI